MLTPLCDAGIAGSSLTVLCHGIGSLPAFFFKVLSCRNEELLQELAHMIMEAEKVHHLQLWTGDPEEPVE